MEPHQDNFDNNGISSRHKNNNLIMLGLLPRRESFTYSSFAALPEQALSSEPEPSQVFFDSKPGFTYKISGYLADLALKANAYLPELSTTVAILAAVGALHAMKKGYDWFNPFITGLFILGRIHASILHQMLNNSADSLAP